MNIRMLVTTLCLTIMGSAVNAATLGLVTSAPTIGADGTVDYLEFGPEGDLSMFGAPVWVSSLTTLDTATAEVDFGVGFDLSDPEQGASGGFSVFDDAGLYLQGDLLDLGFRGFRFDDSIVELHFGNLSGRGTSEWTNSLLMNVIFDGLGGDPLTAFSDGDFYDVEIGVFAVVGGSPPSEVPLPAGGALLLCGFGILWSLKRKRS